MRSSHKYWVVGNNQDLIPDLAQLNKNASDQSKVIGLVLSSLCFYRVRACIYHVTSLMASKLGGSAKMTQGLGDHWHFSTLAAWNRSRREKKYEQSPSPLLQRDT